MGRTTEKAKDWWDGLDRKAKAITAVLTAIAAAGGLIASLVAYIRLEIVKHEVELNESVMRECLRIPDNGQHYIESAPPGGDAIIHWRGVNRMRADCGIPVAVARLVNGGRISHAPELSIGDGLALRPGIQDLSYTFHIPENVKPGRGVFQVFVNFPNAVGGTPPVMSPEVPFIIEEREL